MKTITQTLYVYAISYPDVPVFFKIDTSPSMEGQGWHLIKEIEVGAEVEDIDYGEVIKQKQIDAITRKQEALQAELLEISG